uniref:Uncharacterized protein n=1 Tax=Pyrodinium bahamense TaxID=73915 RepID=A0A7S0A905_9DINO
MDPHQSSVRSRPAALDQCTQHMAANLAGCTPTEYELPAKPNLGACDKKALVSFDGASTSANTDDGEDDESVEAERTELLCPAGLQPPRESSLSTLSIPDEWPVTTPPSERCRRSSPLAFRYWPDEEDYDPRKVENIVPATVEEELRAEVKLLQQQVSRISGMLSVREAREAGSVALHGYKRALEETKGRIEMLSTGATRAGRP